MKSICSCCSYVNTVELDHGFEIIIVFTGCSIPVVHIVRDDGDAVRFRAARPFDFAHDLRPINTGTPTGIGVKKEL